MKGHHIIKLILFQFLCDKYYMICALGQVKVSELTTGQVKSINNWADLDSFQKNLIGYEWVLNGYLSRSISTTMMYM